MKSDALLALGQLSLDLYRAQQAVDSGKTAYHEAWRSFELDGDDPDHYGADEHRIRRGSGRWDEVIKATHDEYMAWQKAKADAYKVKRRWVAACRKAHEQGGA